MYSSLRKTDMNLLLVFDAVYRHRNISLAADQLALSPSALSHALNRLRNSLGDPLFIRHSGKMVPTAKAENIAPQISAALQTLSVCFRQMNAFDPALSTDTFTFAATDYTAAVIMPGLISRINRLAPGITIRLLYSQNFNAVNDIRSGKVDFALGFEEGQKFPQRETEAITCFTDNYIVAVRRGHPEINNILTQALYLAAGHVVVRPWADSQGAIDTYLEKQQLKRRIMVELPSLMTAPLIVSQTDLIITLPEKGITSLFNMQDLVVFPVPFPAPQYILRAYYNPALCDSPGHQWIKEQIMAICSGSNDYITR